MAAVVSEEISCAATVTLSVQAVEPQPSKPPTTVPEPRKVAQVFIG